MNNIYKRAALVLSIVAITGYVVTQNTETQFAYDPWGVYISDGGDFVSYSPNSIFPEAGGMKKHEILYNDNDVRIITDRLELKEGYALMIDSTDYGGEDGLRRATLILTHVNSTERTFINVGDNETYFYPKTFPTIAIHVNKVYMSDDINEFNTIIIDGLWQIGGSPTPDYKSGASREDA